MKKYFFAALLPLFLLVTSAAAVSPSIFPVETVAEDGQSHWGYMDETGAQPIGFFYAEAGVFNEYGLAVVQNVQGQSGVIDQTGRLVVDYQDAPQSIDFGDRLIAFRYADKTLFFTHGGDAYGPAFPATGGFFADDFLRVKQNGLWGYALRDGSMGIAAQFADAGDFVSGRALVRTAGGEYRVLLQNGKTQALPAEPAYLSIFAEDVAILRDGGAMRLYSLSAGAYLGDMIYQQITPFNDDGYAMAKQGNIWGILTPKGKLSVVPEYYYLSYMGEGVYAARGENGEALAIDANNTRIYYTDTYVGGFKTFRFGLSWHGTMDGGVMFFNKNGVFSRKIANAENPEVVSKNVAAVTVDGKRQYIRLSDGKVLYAPVRTYKLDDGIQVTTRQYEKYVGMLQDGSEYGWNLSYPQFTGMKSTAVQTKINSAIEKFFLDGPSQAARKQSLVGDYGFAFYGRVLVVYADAKLGLGAGATIWNDSIALDFSTGQTYSVASDLLRAGYETVLHEQLLADTAYTDYKYARMTDTGLLLLCNTPATAGTPARTESVRILYSSIWGVVNQSGDCYRALTVSAANTSAVPTASSVRFSDVPASHWACSYIEQAAERGLMTGSGRRFQPDASILSCEAVASLARGLSLPDDKMPGVSDAKWYAGEVGAAYASGLLSGMETVDWEKPIPRMDVMQLIANTLRRDNGAALTNAEVSQTLSRFADAGSVPANRREAAAYCVRQGVVTGSGGLLQPRAVITRAEFVKLLLAALPE
ncbi:MAG: S-layer homology domain-containing protein [Intestinibacillus sp.]